MTFADAFDVNVPSELPQEATLHQYAAGGFRDLRRGRSQPVWRHTAPDGYQRHPHLYHPADPRALHAACHVHRRPPDVVLRFRGADHTRNDGTVSNACQQAVKSVSGGESIKTHLVLAWLLFFSFPPTSSQLKVVSRVGVDVRQRFLHGQSEEDQLAEVVPAVLAFLDGRRRGRSGRRKERREEKKDRLRTDGGEKKERKEGRDGGERKE